MRFLILLSALLPALAIGNECAADPKRGKQLFQQCIGCHFVNDKHATGPSLAGIVDSQIARHQDFPYSQALLTLREAGAIWDMNALDQFLADPQAFSPGTKMIFPGISDASQRADLMAYLAEQNLVIVESSLIIPNIPGDPAYGEYLSSECLTCHSSTGADSGIPSITGWEELPFLQAMHAYKAGKRTHPVMEMVAGRLSDEEIASLATYFSALDKP